MLLVAKQDMVQQGAVRGKERAGYLECLGMPELSFPLHFIDVYFFRLEIPELHNESDFGGDTEVPNNGK